MFKKLINKLFGRQDFLSFKAGFDLTELPIITLYQGKEKFNFILDTGSNSSIIDSNILHKLEYDHTDSDDTIMGMEGNTVPVKACNITFCFNDKAYRYKYLINDMGKPFQQMKDTYGVTLHGIIGSNFFNEFKYVLDFDKLIAYSKL